jgi:hypothetical protein
VTSGSAVKSKYLPPAVTVDCDAVRAAKSLTPVLGVGVAVYILWALLSSPRSWLGTIVLATVGLCVWIAGREISSMPLQTLAWTTADGWRFKLCGEPEATEMQQCTPRIVLDLQRVMLLRVTASASRTYWLWMRSHNARSWHRLRCALYDGRQP